jgi:hypothetical protein
MNTRYLNVKSEAFLKNDGNEENGVHIPMMTKFAYFGKTLPHAIPLMLVNLVYFWRGVLSKR